MGACVSERVLVMLFEFVSEVQHTSLQINDHQVISRGMSKSSSDLFFESFVPPFKVSNMMGLGHVPTNPRCRFFKRGERARYGNVIT